MAGRLFPDDRFLQGGGGRHDTPISCASGLGAELPYDAAGGARGGHLEERAEEFAGLLPDV